jgi:hypothetical protein
MTTLLGPLAVTVSIGEISLARVEPFKVRSRCSVCTTASALNGVPSLNLIPLRSGMVTVSLSFEIVGSPDASCGTICAFALRS